MGFPLSPDIDRRTLFHFSASYLAFPRNHPEVKVARIFSGALRKISAEFRGWLKATNPDVILAHGDQRPFLAGMGLRIPEEIGFVNLNLLAEDAEVSGINPLFELVGEGAVDIVVACLHRNEFGLPNHPRTALITGEWIEGQTIRVQ